MSDGLPVRFELSALARELLDALREFKHARVDDLTRNRDRGAVLRAMGELRRLGLVTIEAAPRDKSVVRITDEGLSA